MAEKPLTADMKWSFSKLYTYAECPYGFWLRYLQDPPLPDSGNAWSDYGTLCHALLEEYALGKISILDLADEYERRYNDAIVHEFPPFPKGYSQKTYQQGLDYFSNFEGFDEDTHDIVSAEEKFEIKVGDNTLVGISDLVLRNRETGRLIVIDHKTKSLKSMQHDFSLYRNQLYLYALHVKERYGEYPEKLIFNMLKAPDKSFVEPFSEEQMKMTCEWIENRIDDIYLEDKWPALKADEIRSGKGDYYCRYICPVFGYCSEAQEAFAERTRR